MTGSPKDSEIERRFLIQYLPDNLDACTCQVIAQGYLASSPEESVRIRLKNNQRVMTVKQGKGLARTEVEIPIDEGQFAKLWPLTAGRRIEKNRYPVPLENDLVAELDVFRGDLEGHCQVEVEFPDEKSAGSFVPPAWFGREVTQDGRYTNAELSVRGVPRDDENDPGKHA